MSFETIEVATDGAVGIITLNRPKAMNALNEQLMDELSGAVAQFESDDSIGAIVLTGTDNFAAGADIGEMQSKTFAEAYKEDFITRNWESVSRARKPVIAAVAGYALGGGCELAMMCDIIIAADDAHFGQPEIRLGITPGAGGTQRLTRAVGKSKAMEMCLTGEPIDAAAAERAGLVSRVVPAGDLRAEAVALAARIASHSKPAAAMVKEAVNRAFETGLSEGIRFERRLFHAAFSTADQKEGMAAFLEKRKPDFKDE